MMAAVGCSKVADRPAVESEMMSRTTEAGTAWTQPDPVEAYCYGTFCMDDIGEIRNLDDVQRVLSALHAAGAANPALHPVDCHIIAHEVGEQFGATGASLLEIFDGYDGSCTSGYLHGAISVYARTNSIESQGAIVAERCRATSGGNTLTEDDCIHGYGHAVAEKEHSSIKATLAGCDSLPVADRGTCASGALMEVYAHQLANWEGSTLCLQVTSEYLDECYIALWAFARNNGETLETFVSWCPDGEHARACGNGIGNWLYTESGDISAVLDSCLRYMSGGVELVDGCVQGGVSYHISMETTDGSRINEYVST
jgi:hypothetical protein